MEIDFSLPWERMSMAEAMQQFAGIGDLSYESLVSAAREKRHRIEDGESYDSVFFKIFLNEVENKFNPARPLILYDYPAELGALAKKKDSRPDIAERFEIYVGGLEIANAFSELLDPAEQKQRFLEEQKIRKNEGRKVYPIDEDLLLALGEIKSPCGGIALGIDRLVMLLTNQKEINNVIFFPAKELFY
jgi:elongation factor P--beta-lysine ligase